MNRIFSIALILVGTLPAAPRLMAQSPADPAPDKGKPASGSPAQQQGANPFPEDTSTIPVMPSRETAPIPQGKFTTSDAMPAGVTLPSADTDPVRSPDDPPPAEANDEGSSSSLKNIDDVLPPPELGPPEKKGKHPVKEKEQTKSEVAKEDIDVGKYYLDRKNWRGAQSRFESALVLDPENPDVYWGLAEAERNLGQYAKAREHYQLLLEYDPDSRHGREARKALSDPAIASAPKLERGKNSATGPQ